MFSELDELDRPRLEGLAQRQGLDVARLRAALDAQAHRAHIQLDRAQAETLRVDSTPTLFLNGRRIQGLHPVEFWRQEIDRELAQASARAAEADLPEAPSLSIPNARRPSRGMLVGGQPSLSQLDEAKALGFRMVINLRPAQEPGALAEEAAHAQALGLRLVELPLAEPKDLTTERVRAFAAALADRDGYPVLVHCSSGNRAGALLALKAHILDGRSAEEALEVGRGAGLTRWEQAVRELLARGGMSDDQEAED
jgi:uncharacterized protein (TIGR01244 family)